MLGSEWKLCLQSRWTDIGTMTSPDAKWKTRAQKGETFRLDASRPWQVIYSSEHVSKSAPGHVKRRASVIENLMPHRSFKCLLWGCSKEFPVDSFFFPLHAFSPLEVQWYGRRKREEIPGNTGSSL